jgi:hypothetical protein
VESGGSRPPDPETIAYSDEEEEEDADSVGDAEENEEPMD